MGQLTKASVAIFHVTTDCTPESKAQHVNRPLQRELRAISCIYVHGMVHGEISTYQAHYPNSLS